MKQLMLILAEEIAALKDRISVLEKQIDVRDEQIIDLYSFKKAVEKILEDAE